MDGNFEKWLQEFIHTALHPVVIFSFAAAPYSLALVTVSFQAIKAAIANPVKSLWASNSDKTFYNTIGYRRLKIPDIAAGEPCSTHIFEVRKPFMSASKYHTGSITYGAGQPPGNNNIRHQREKQRKIKVDYYFLGISMAICAVLFLNAHMK